MVPTRIAKHVFSNKLPPVRLRPCTTITGNAVGQNPDFGSLYLLCNTTRLVKQLHAFLLVTGRSGNVFSTKLINLYADAGEVSLAHLAFRSVAKRYVLAWNSMVSAYVKNGCFREAMEVFSEMLEQRVRPDRFTFPAVLKVRLRLYYLSRKGKWTIAALLSWGLLRTFTSLPL